VRTALRLVAFLLCATTGALALAPAAAARERILDFHSDIAVEQSGAMQVRETIKVVAEGRQIRHGIYRDFPTEYQDRAGNRYHVGFEVVRVLRDGQPEDYHTKPVSNGVRVYIGSKHRYVSHGEHSYTLIYDTDRQLGFFKDHDELYWNVTGNGWIFPIDRASASVTLPPAVPRDAIRIEGYTGAYGSKAQDYTTQVSSDGSAQIATTRPLGPREGLTVVVSWPKGYVHEPTSGERAQRLLEDNANLLVALIGLLFVLLYYYLVWRAVGRDPTTGVIIPIYQPPEGFSPASLRFVSRMGYDNKAFTAAIVNLAINGLIRIEEYDGVYTLKRTDKRADRRTAKLAPGEGALLKKLFPRHKYIVLKNENHTRVSEAISAHKKSLKNDYEKKYFLNNTPWLIPGILLTVLVLAVSALLTPSRFGPMGLVAMLWLSGWTLGVVALAQRMGSAWRSVGQGGAGMGSAIGITLFALPFFFFELVGIGMLAYVASVSVVIVLIVAVAINVGFYHWIKRPTRTGRRLLDKIEGFRLYLDVAEGEELKRADPLEKTPALFEAYLPYAIALDLEQRWAGRFSGVFDTLAARGETYQPLWYTGSHWSPHRVGGFAAAVGGSLSSAISSSATAPGSSSGGGGGGFSGGGGGGGGGGGW